MRFQLFAILGEANMRRFILAVVVVLVLVSLGLFAVTSSGQQAIQPKIQKWEYLSTRNWQDGYLNDYGNQGWELCGTYEAPEGQSPGVVVVLKRPKQ